MEPQITPPNLHAVQTDIIGEANYDPDYSFARRSFLPKRRTGTQVWNFSVGTSFTTPKVSEGIAYVGGHDYTPSTDVNVGFIYA